MKLLILTILLSFISFDLLAQYQNVIIYQRLENGDPVGELRKWEGSEFGDPFSPGSDFDFLINSTQVILGDQAIHSAQKYNNWNQEYSNVKNHQEFPISSQTNILTSWFEPTNTGITIQTNLEETGVNSGVVEFRDPWFIDFGDTNYDDQLINIGRSKVGVLQNNFG